MLAYPVDSHRRHMTQEWNSLSERLWSIKVDVTNLLCGWVQPVEFLRTEVNDECCRRDKALSRRHQHCAIVSWQIWSLDLSIAARTVTPEQITATVINDIKRQSTKVNIIYLHIVNIHAIIWLWHKSNLTQTGNTH